MATTTLHLLSLELQKHEVRACRCCGRSLEEGDRGFAVTAPADLIGGVYCRVACAEEVHRAAHPKT